MKDLQALAPSYFETCGACIRLLVSADQHCSLHGHFHDHLIKYHSLDNNCDCASIIKCNQGPVLKSRLPGCLKLEYL
jgi:hypothetical protein